MDENEEFNEIAESIDPPFGGLIVFQTEAAPGTLTHVIVANEEGESAQRTKTLIGLKLVAPSIDDTKHYQHEIMGTLFEGFCTDENCPQHQDEDGDIQQHTHIAVDPLQDDQFPDGGQMAMFDYAAIMTIETALDMVSSVLHAVDAAAHMEINDTVRHEPHKSEL